MYDNIQHPSTSYILLHCIKAWKKYIIVVHGDIGIHDNATHDNVSHDN